MTKTDHFEPPIDRTEFDRLYPWSTVASGSHILRAFEDYGTNPYNYELDEFLIREGVCIENVQKCCEMSPRIAKAFAACKRRLILNFRRMSLTHKEVNVQYALAIAPVIDPEYRSWLLEYGNKQKETKAAALKDWMAYLKAKDEELPDEIH